MRRIPQSKIAAATGAVFAVVLFIANGNAGRPSAPREVAATAAITLLIPFGAYLGVLIREHGRPGHAWLATTTTAAAAVGATIKLVSGVPELALNRTETATGSQLYDLLDAMAGAATVIALIPLALFCLAAGLGSLRSGVLPPWLAVGALVCATGLAANACVVDTNSVPALVVMILWCLLASIHLVRTAGREPLASTSNDAVSTAA